MAQRTQSMRLSIDLVKIDANLFLADKSLENKINEELANIHTWLCANKLSLNIDKTNFVIFHSPQRTIHQNINLEINNKPITQKLYLK